MINIPWMFVRYSGLHSLQIKDLKCIFMWLSYSDSLADFLVDWEGDEDTFGCSKIGTNIYMIKETIVKISVWISESSTIANKMMKVILKNKNLLGFIYNNWTVIKIAL